MRIRWRFGLPVVGLLLFGGLTYSSLVFFNLATPNGRYFYWSSIRLDRRPLQPLATESCKDTSEDCVHWEPIYIAVDPGPLAKLFVLLALPAFAIGKAIVSGTSRLGISEVTTFMVSMPLLITGWLYLLGRIIESWATRAWLTCHWPITAALGLLILAASVESEILRAITAAICIALMVYQWLVYRRISRAARRVFLSLFPIEVGLVSTWLALNVARFYSYDPENTVTWAWHERFVHIQDVLKWSTAGLAVVILAWLVFHLARWFSERIFRKTCADGH